MQLDHISLNAISIDAMVDFYSNLLGISVERYDAFLKGEADFPTLRLTDDCVINLFPETMWANESSSQTNSTHNLNHLCLRMEEDRWTHIKSCLEENKVAIEIGPTAREGALGHGMSIFLRDPDGNLIELKHDNPKP